MRIVQTFWSGTGNPLNKSYGWNHAEHNLMSWALSCCSLREHYDDVILYTDRQGYEVLIEKLRVLCRAGRHGRQGGGQRARTCDEG